MKLLPLFIVLLFISNFSCATTYFVSKTGNDNNVGGPSSSWLTIQKAASVMVAGDSLFIHQGTYNEIVIAQFSGTSTDPIVYSNFQNETVIIDGTGINLNGWNGVFDVSNQDFIKVIGLEVHNSTFAGFWAENTSFIEFINTKTYNTYSSGIGIWDSNHIKVKNNEIELACNDGGEECITIANSNHCDIINNNVHHNGLGTNGGEGIDIKQGSFAINVIGNAVHHLNGRLGIYVDAWDAHTYDIVIDKNVVHHCKESGFALASESGGLLENVIIINNISHHNKYGGIELGAWSDIGFTGAKPIKDIKIINNTCYKNGSYDGGWGYGITINNPHAENVTIRNNICSQNSAQLAVENSLNAPVIDHNLIDGSNNTPESVSGANAVIGNAEFWDVTLDNFNLKPNSGAIDNGSAIDAPPFDFNNYPRPQGSAVDIGALEYNATANVATLHAIDFEVFPNPVRNMLSVIVNESEQNKYILNLYNMYGVLIKSVNLNLYNSNIDVSEFSQGIYSLEIFRKDIPIQKSVIKIVVSPF